MTSTTATNTTQPPTPELDPDEARISAALAQDRPTIDAAVKSFLSLVCARDMTASMTDQANVESTRVLMGVVSMKENTAADLDGKNSQKQQALQVARAILQACNSHEFPVHKTVASELRHKPGLSDEKKESLLELSVIARLWNGLVQSKQKPTRFLGRKALLQAWEDLDVASKLAKPKGGEDADEAAKSIYTLQLAWVEEFGQLLMRQPDPNSTDDNDAALLWDVDGGQAELARRRQRRQSAATERGPVITPA
jgi:hypothetical protein